MSQGQLKSCVCPRTLDTAGWSLYLCEGPCTAAWLPGELKASCAQLLGLEHG
jgi:hypothetical protein